MVEINKTFITLTVATIAASIVCAQQIKPRIAGLESNERYMHLLLEDERLTHQEDSVTVVVEQLRDQFRNSTEKSAVSRDQIIALENQLFELRSRKGLVVDSLNVIEQEWVANNIDVGASLEPTPPPTTLVSGSTSAKYIYESPNVKTNLSSVDYRNLVKAEELEIKTEKLSQSYVVNYENMLSLKNSYESTSRSEEADEIMHKFDSLSTANSRLLERLDDSWAFIYDNKSFAYSLLMELLGFDDVMQREAELMRKAQAEISSKQGGGGDDELMRYYVQKSSMVEFEGLVASRLELPHIVDSLGVIAKKMALVEKTSPQRIGIKERNFIKYEEFKIVNTPYYTASNPIPETVIYDKGVIFRIYVGSFQTKQSASIFRNTIPVSHRINEKRRHCYYIGGYETFEEAQEARTALKKHGFRVPQIVVWSDGRERNLTTDPLPLSAEYRIEILDSPVLPEGTLETVGRIAPDSPISKVGNDRFVVTALSRQGQVDSLVGALKALDPDLKINIERNEAEIKF